MWQGPLAGNDLVWMMPDPTGIDVIATINVLDKANSVVVIWQHIPVSERQITVQMIMKMNDDLNP